jgi:predicted transcriptional regulator
MNTFVIKMNPVKILTQTEDIRKYCKELSNHIQLNLLEILSTKMSLNEIIEIMAIQKNRHVYRETIYKKLECLINLGIVKKEYNQNKKKLVYYVIQNKIVLNLKNGEKNERN